MLEKIETPYFYDVHLNFKDFLRKQGSPLTFIILQPTPFCNIDCKYCYLPDRNNKGRMSNEVVAKTLEHLLNNGLLNCKDVTLCWHAGEPMVLPISYYKEKIELVNRLNTSSCKIHHHFQTNGTLITDEYCKFFIEKNIQIGISIDGPDFIHDRVRVSRSGNGTFKKAMKGIELLHKYNIPFNTISVLTDFSLDYPDEMFKFFQEIGTTNAGMNIEEIENYNTSSSITASPVLEVKYKNFIKRLYELTNIHKPKFEIREITRTANIIMQGGLDIQALNLPLSIITVDYLGNFSTFAPELFGDKKTKYGDFVFGNVFEKDFLSVFDNIRFTEIYNDIVSGVKLCKATCNYYDYCGGGSPANKVFENGTFNSADTVYCKYYKKILTDAVLESMEQNLI